MHNPIEDRYVQGLLDRCALRRDEKACMILDKFLAVTRFRGRIDDLLSRPPIKWPPGPDPSPEVGVAEVDPDGSPAIVLTEGLTRGSARAKARLEMAVELQRGLREISEVLARDVEALGAYAGALAKT